MPSLKDILSPCVPPQESSKRAEDLIQLSKSSFKSGNNGLSSAYHSQAAEVLQ